MKWLNNGAAWGKPWESSQKRMVGTLAKNATAKVDTNF